MQIGPRTAMGVALIVGSRLHRMRWFLGLSRELWIVARAPGDGEAAFTREYRDRAAADDHGGLLDVQM